MSTTILLLATLVLAALALIAVWLITMYNGLIALKNQTEEAWSGIDIQLKRRSDLLPNLVATVKGFATHEEKTLTAVITARNAALRASGVAGRAKAEGEVMRALSGLFALSENYPDLKSAPNFLSLQSALSETEELIQSARRFYNANVRDLNIRIESFPTNFIAETFGFHKMEFFESENPAEREPVKVSF